MTPKFRIIKPGDNTNDIVPDGIKCHLIVKNMRQNSADRYISKFGGLPYLLADQEWPVCSACNEAMAFILQFRTDDMPKKAKKFPDMIRFFYCFDCHPWWNVDFRGFKITKEAIKPQAELMPAKNTPWQVAPLVKALAIKFKAIIDYPHLEDFESWKTLDRQSQQLATNRYPVQTASKLGGYPAWLNKSDVPDCPYCEAKMEFLAQINSGEDHKIIWSDSGRMLIFTCPHSCNKDAFSIVLQSE